MGKLTELAERCERATIGRFGSEVLNRAIGEATSVGGKPGRLHGKNFTVWPNFTGSIDAAMTLVPEGLKILVDEHARSWVVTLWSNTVTPVAESEAATEPLARAAVALKARARTQNTPDSQKERG